MTFASMIHILITVSDLKNVKKMQQRIYLNS